MWRCGETTISAVLSTQNFGSIFWTFSRFTTVPAHFHRLMERFPSCSFFSEDAFQGLQGFCVQVGMKVDVPPLPAFAVQQQIAAVRRQTVASYMKNGSSVASRACCQLHAEERRQQNVITPHPTPRGPKTMLVGNRKSVDFTSTVFGPQA